MSVSEILGQLSETTKRTVDASAAGLAVFSLTRLSLVLAIIASALTIAWYAIRIHDRLKHGPGQ